MAFRRLSTRAGTWLLTLGCVALLAQGGCASEEDDKDGESKGRDAEDSDGSDGDSDGDSEAATLQKYSAGSRLKPYFLEASDGAKQFYGWYDEELEVPCSFSMLSTATMPLTDKAKVRCLPTMLSVKTGTYHGNNSCDGTEPLDIAVIGQCAEPSKIAYAQVQSDACSGHLEIRKVRSVEAQTKDDWFWQEIDGRCRLVDTELARYAIVKLGDEVTIDTFVSAGPTK